MAIYKYQVADAGYKLGKEKNILFATNDRSEAVKAANDSGEGVIVLKNQTNNSDELIVYISPYKTELEIAE